MRVSPTRTTFENRPPSMASFAFSPESNAFISLDKEYEVYALSVFRGTVFLQIINDLDTIDWLPAWLFEVRDTSLPSDWIGNFFQGEVGLVLGPEFVASDEMAYARMVELDLAALEKFRQRKNALTGSSKKLLE